MADFNSNNNTNNENKKSVNTRGCVVYNAEQPEPSAFEWSYFDDLMRIVLTPELPSVEQTEKRRYDYDHSWVTCISRVKCLELFNQFKSKIESSMNTDKKPIFVSVTISGVNQFGIGIRFKEDGTPIGYVKLIRNMNENRISSDVITYEFRKSEAIINYDNETGNFDSVEHNDTEMLLFIHDLEAFVTASSKAFNHANRVVDKFHKDSLITMLRAIGVKVGAELPDYGSGFKSGAKYGSTSLFSSSSVQAPTSTIKSLDELNVD